MVKNALISCQYCIRWTFHNSSGTQIISNNTSYNLLACLSVTITLERQRRDWKKDHWSYSLASTRWVTLSSPNSRPFFPKGARLANHVRGAHSIWSSISAKNFRAEVNSKDFLESSHLFIITSSTVNYINIQLVIGIHLIVSRSLA